MKPSLTNEFGENSPAGSSQMTRRSAILPGAYVHRRGEVQKDERFVADFWRRSGFEVELIEDPRVRFSRLPDLLLSRNGVRWAYCEVKTIWKHGWTVRVLHDDRPAEELREFTDKPVYERVAGDLLTAVRQLHAANPNHSILNIVVLVNRDPEASIDVFKKVLSSRPSSSRRTLKARMDARAAEEIEQFQKEVDLCIWMDALGTEEPAMGGYILFHPGPRELTKGIAGLSSGKLISLEPAA
jgi:hypothetical protein